MKNYMTDLADPIIKDEELKQRIKRKANKIGYYAGECLVNYNQHIYLIKFDEDAVIRQREFK